MYRTCVVLTVAAAVLAAAGCTGDPAGAPPSKVAKGVIDEPATLKPLKLSEEPLWSNDDVPGMKTVSHAEIHGDAALVFGSDEKAPPLSKLAVVDAAWEGRIFTTPSGGLDGTSYDRSGNRIDEALPGELSLISDRYAVFHPDPHDPEDRRLVVHRRLR